MSEPYPSNTIRCEVCSEGRVISELVIHDYAEFDYMLVTDVCTVAERRCEGHATRLLDHACLYAKAYGKGVYLIASEDMAGFYANRGFEKVRDASIDGVRSAVMAKGGRDIGLLSGVKLVGEEEAA